MRQNRTPVKRTLALLKIFLLAYTKRSVFVLVCLLLAGLAEGLGIATLLPLLSIAASGNNTGDDILSQSVDRLLGAVNLEPGVGVLLGLIVIVMLLKAILVLLAARQVGYATAHVATDLRLRLIRALMKASWKHFVIQPSGAVSNALTTEAERASHSYVSVCRLIASVLQIAVYAGMAALVSWQLTLGALGVGTLSMVLLSMFVGIARRAGEQKTELLKAVSSRLIDGLGSFKVLKAMACEDKLGPFLEAETEALNRAQERLVFSNEGMRVLQEPLVVVSLAIGLYLALNLWQSNIGSLMVMALLFYRTVTRIGFCQKQYQDITSYESAFWSLNLTLQTYGKKVVLRDVSFKIPFGSFVALIGASGAGKTTVADLIIGLMQPQEGQILIDGMPLTELNLKTWRGMIGYVPQETTLFNDTLSKNVSLGDPELTFEDVKSALKDAGALDFSVNLRNGLNTNIGEHGAKLSGGQRQRIAIARALIRKPKILILDEATTGLDSKTEAAICETLKKLAARVTILAISHQPPIKDIADIVYQLEYGSMKKVGDVVQPAAIAGTK
jgi:ATP-binding cassette subfamily C protein